MVHQIHNKNRQDYPPVGQTWYRVRAGNKRNGKNTRGIYCVFTYDKEYIK